MLLYSVIITALLIICILCYLGNSIDDEYWSVTNITHYRDTYAGGLTPSTMFSIVNERNGRAQTRFVFGATYNLDKLNEFKQNKKLHKLGKKLP